MSDEEDVPLAARRVLRRVMVVSSGEDSEDSDGSVAVSGARRKRLRVSSESSSGSDSSGSVVLAPRRRLPRVRDSGSEADAAPDTAPPPPTGAPKPDGFSSDSSEGNSDKCSICLLRIRDQQVGIPENCEHIFCLDCITEWSKNVNTCPVDRMTFNSIIVRVCAGGKVLRAEPVKVTERRPSIETLVIEDITHCEICGSADSEESMLLCDGCDLGFHMRCLNPPLTQIPEDQWLCPNCSEYVVDLSELNSLWMDLVELELPVGPRPSSLRVERNVRRSGRQQTEAGTSAGTSGSLGGPSTSGTSRAGARATTAPTRRANNTRKRRYKRRRTKTVIIEYEVEENGKFPVRKTLKKKIKKRKSRRKPRTAARRSFVRANVRAQLAAQKKDRAVDSNGHSGVTDLNIRRHMAGIPSLSLFGSPYELDYVSDEELWERDGSDVVATAVRPSRAISTAYRQARRKMISVPSPPAASSACDILDSIMAGQELLHSKRTQISVAADGRLEYQRLKGGGERGRQAPNGSGATAGGGASWRAPNNAAPNTASSQITSPIAQHVSPQSTAPAAPSPPPTLYDRPCPEDKYDPTSPTNDSGDEAPTPRLSPPRFSAAVLQGAVRQVLADHRLYQPPSPTPADDDDGDCPNFSIYSAASVHIASTTSLAPTPVPMTPAPVAPQEDFNSRLSRKCPITTNVRTPIKIKLNTPSLIKRPVALYDEEPEDQTENTETTPTKSTESDNNTSIQNNDVPKLESPETMKLPPEELENAHEDRNGDCDTPTLDDNDMIEQNGDHGEDEQRDDDFKDDDNPEGEGLAFDNDDDKLDQELRSEEEAEMERNEQVKDKTDKLTESISETEDERSYTPCLDENKSKDTSLETDRDKALEGLDTELISEEEGNDIFSDGDKASPPAKSDKEDGAKKKKKKESKKEFKEKSKDKKKKSDVAFKKLSKSGKERNYREREKEKDRECKNSKKDRASSAEAARRVRRQDLQRYDVRARLTRPRPRPRDPFGRDLRRSAEPGSPRSPRRASRSPRRRRSGSRKRSISPRRRSISPRKRSITPRRRSISPRRRSLSRKRSITPRKRSITPRKRSITPRKRSITPRKRSITPRKRSITPRKRSITPRKRSITPRKRSITPRKRSITPHKSSITPRKRSMTPRKRSLTPRKRSVSPRKRTASPRRPSPSPPRPPRRKKKRRLSPPPPAAVPSPSPPRRRRVPRAAAAAPSSKEVFTSGDNILVSVSFKDQDRGRNRNRNRDRTLTEKRKKKDSKKEKRKKRKRVIAPEIESSKPVAIIDLDRSPFAEIATSPKNVIVLSDSDNNEPPAPPPRSPLAPTAPALVPVGAGGPGGAGGTGPKTPPSPAAPAPPAPDAATPPDSPDAYDPFEPTRSPEPPLTLDQRGAEEVLARRPVSPLEKVLALLASTRASPPLPPPSPPAPPVRAVAPLVPGPLGSVGACAGPLGASSGATSPPAPAALVRKPEPIKSNPVKPMVKPRQPALLPLPQGDSPYSPGSSDFGDLFEPPLSEPQKDSFDALFDKLPHRRNKNKHNKHKKKGGTKTQVGVKMDDDSFKILDDLPSSAVEMQVKSKFLKKLNRQERVVEEVKLVLKPHYNKKRVTKEEYKDILRRAVPKICHNKSGEINPTKIQALVEAYVRKFRKRHKLGLGLHKPGLGLHN